MRADRHLQRGFTLIEVLVAFAIFALSIGALFEVFADSSRRAQKAERNEMLWLTAESVLSELRIRPAPWPAEEHGERGGWQWRVVTQPYDAGTDPTHPWKAVLVSVEVAETSARGEVKLQSVELMRSGS